MEGATSDHHSNTWLLKTKLQLPYLFRSKRSFYHF